MQNKLIKEIENISHTHVYNKGYAKICNNFKFLHSTYTKLTLAGRKNIWRIQLSKDIKESLANVILQDFRMYKIWFSKLFTIR